MGLTGDEDGVHCRAVGGHHSRARGNAWRHSKIEVCGRRTRRSGWRQLQMCTPTLQQLPSNCRKEIALSSKASQGNPVTIY